MTQTTPPIEKRRNYPGLISIGCGVVGFISGFLCGSTYAIYEKSLYTNHVAGNFSGICFYLWFLSTALGLLCWIISLFLILPIWGIRFRATGVVLGLILPMLSGIAVPPQGLVHPHARAYYPVSDPAAIQYIQDFSKSTENIDRQFIKDTYEQDYSDYDYDTNMRTDTITVKYNLRPGVERTDLPKSFSVLIDRKTKKTEIFLENDMPQKAKNTKTPITP